jgi:acetoin utilization protein AcuB
MSTNVSSIMSKSVVTVSSGDSLLDATRVLKEKRIKHLPVLDRNGALVGVVTDRDLKRASASDATTLEVHELLYLLDKVQIESVMTRRPATLSPAATVEEAAKLMVERKIGCLPVVEGNKLAGIVTKADLLALLARSTL